MTKEQIIKVAIDELRPNPYQPEGRVEVDELTAKAFGLSILEHGLIQTPVVRRLGGEASAPPVYEMGDGWLRRSGFAWLVKNGHPEYAKMPVVVREFTNQQMADLIMESNNRRKDLNPLQLAGFYRKYLADFPKVTQAELARRFNVSQGEVANTIRLLDLPAEVQAMIISHEITESHGRSLLRLKDKAAIVEKARVVVQYGLNVAGLESLISTYLGKQSPQMIETPAETPLTSEPPPKETAAPVTELPLLARDDKPAPPVKEAVAPPKPPTTAIPPTGITAKQEPSKPPEKAPEKTPERQPEKPRTSTPTPAPAATLISAAPAPPRPNWGRKLVIEEKPGHVMMSCMKAGGLPVFKKVDGGLVENMEVVTGWLQDLEAEWSKEVK